MYRYSRFILETGDFWPENGEERCWRWRRLHELHDEGANCTVGFFFIFCCFWLCSVNAKDIWINKHIFYLEKYTENRDLRRDRTSRRAGRGEGVILSQGSSQICRGLYPSHDPEPLSNLLVLPTLMQSFSTKLHGNRTDIFCRILLFSHANETLKWPWRWKFWMMWTQDTVDNKNQFSQ